MACKNGNSLCYADTGRCDLCRSDTEIATLRAALAKAEAERDEAKEDRNLLIKRGVDIGLVDAVHSRLGRARKADGWAAASNALPVLDRLDALVAAYNKAEAERDEARRLIVAFTSEIQWGWDGHKERDALLDYGRELAKRGQL